MNKAFCGVQAVNEELPLRPFSTGKWGCGAFRGDPQLKFVIQLCACAAAHRPMYFHPFDDPQLARQIQSFLTAVRAKRPSIGLVSVSHLQQHCFTR